MINNIEKIYIDFTFEDNSALISLFGSHNNNLVLIEEDFGGFDKSRLKK